MNSCWLSEWQSRYHGVFTHTHGPYPISHVDGLLLQFLWSCPCCFMFFSQRDLWLIFNRWAKGSHITSSAEKVPVAGSIHGFVWTCWGGKTLVVQNMFEDHFPFLDYHFEGIPWYNTYWDTPRSIPTTCIMICCECSLMFVEMCWTFMCRSVCWWFTSLFPRWFLLFCDV